MKSVHLFKPHNRLAELARRPGGKTAGEALAAADARVDGKRAELAATLPAATARLRTLADQAEAHPGLALEQLYVAANQIFALAAAVGMNALADAAYSLCDLIDGFRDGVDVRWEAVDVHVDAIRLLGSKTDQAAGDQAIAGALKRVGSRFGKPVG